MVIRIERKTVKAEGACNFCERGVSVFPEIGMKYPYSEITQISKMSGGGIMINVCDDCLIIIKSRT